MLPYVLIFIVAVSLTFFGQRIVSTRKYLGWGLFIVSIFILSLFAALRDYSVGADLLAHKKQYFDLAMNYDSITRYLSLFDGEFLFDALTYFVAHLTGSMRVLMFIIMCVPLSVMYHYLAKINVKYITIGLVVFLLMFFNTSLNVLRQVMAISLIIPAFFSIYNNKILRGIAFILLAFLFHKSAIVMFLILPICIFSRKPHQVRYYVLLSLGFLILCLSLANLSSTPWMSSIAGSYFGYLKTESTNLNIHFFILKILLFAVVTYFYRYYKNDRMCRCFYYFAILDLLFYFFSNYVIYGYRLSYYFVVFYPFFIPMIASKLDNRQKTLFYVVVGSLLILYWIDRNIIIGYDSTIPYLLGV